MAFGKFGRAGAIWLFLFVALVGLAAVAYGVRMGTPTVMAQDMDDDALTKAYVDRASDYLRENGAEATIARYSDPTSVEGERFLVLLDPETRTILASPFPLLVGSQPLAYSREGQYSGDIERATEEGHWIDSLATNPLTGQQEPARFFMALREGLIFNSFHFVVKENVEDTTKNYVARAIERYESDGPEAMVEYYNSRESIDGQFYLFMMDENDIYLVHPIFPHLIGTDIKDVVGSDGQELGKEIAQATEDGIWVEYLWPNPVTLNEESKVTWAIRHDGKIFASGYYTGREEAGTPPWVGTDPREYTEEYVNQAIERYEEYGLEPMKAYYNSVASFEGEFYLFVMDANDIYIVHPLFPRLIGTDIKDVVGSDGQELGKEIAQATEDGIWVEYLWPYPVTLADAPKVAYAKRHDGYIFASGYYPLPDDPRAYTRDYIQKAIDLYESDGLEAMVAHYNSRDSMDGQWYLEVIDRDDIVIVNSWFSRFIGLNAAELPAVDGSLIGPDMLKATEEGYWFGYISANDRGAGNILRNTLVIRHDGLIFASGYFGDQSASAAADDPAPEARDASDALTQAYVNSAIEYYMDRGLGKTAERYGNPLTWKAGSYLIVADAQTHILVSSPLLYLNGKGVDALVPDGELGGEIEDAMETGHWFDSSGLNMLTGEQEAARYYITVRDGLAFMSPSFANIPAPAPRPEPEPESEPDDDALTMAYVMKAIERYESDGREATVAYYNSRESVEGQRFMSIIDADTNVLLTSPLRPAAVGVTVPATATEEGIWIERQGSNPITNQREPRRTFFILRDGLIFAASHSALRENIAQATKNYVAKATELYDSEGLDATIAYYDSRESVDGQFYLFLIGADDIYLAHPIFPHLKGTDIKDVVSSDGQELGREIAQATEEGIWVEYLWPNPVTGLEDSKITWAIRHDGLIFASGYYTGEADSAPPPWQDADPREYTVDYVNRAVERYERDGLEAMKAYYNSVAAFEGQWYLFATDANDIYHVHPLLPRLIGTDIKDVVGADGYELGKEIAKATEEGHWIEYIWPHPSTLKNAPKVSYAVRRDGMIFASGYYPEPEDPAAYTKSYVQKAIDYYEENGLDATVAHYNSEDSFEGQWYLGLADSDSRILVSAVVPHVIGSQLNPETAVAIDAGRWVELEWFGNLTAGTTFRHIWGTRHDGLYFYSGYFVEQGTPLPEADME